MISFIKTKGGILLMKFISYDLGTGGVKASLYDSQLHTIARSFIEYQTFYPGKNRHEQRPGDWWNGIVQSTRLLLKESSVSPDEITAAAVSGHSCVAVPVDHQKQLLTEYVPIWSDTRADSEAASFFQKVDNETWYLTTGCGFPAPCYSIFKLMWCRKNMPETYSKICQVMGSKDFINLKLTGNIFTDFSYASSTGAYNLHTRRMEASYLEAADIEPSFFPEIIPSHDIVGTVTAEAAEETGLSRNTLVVCGGVDNACMALGAVGTENGRIYTSLGSSSWVPVNSEKPILDPVKRPYVFAHIDENKYTSAFSIFAGGSSFRWTRDALCPDFDSRYAYEEMSACAARSPVGSNGIFFNPSLAGGTSQDKSVHIRGAYIGLHLGTSRNDMIRAAMEGIALNLRMSVDSLSAQTKIGDEILFCGGGSKSPVWMQIFADVFDKKIIKTSIDQDAAALGAAAICAKAVGLWQDYTPVRTLHQIEKTYMPNPENVPVYSEMLKKFRHICTVLADLGDYLSHS